MVQFLNMTVVDKATDLGEEEGDIFLIFPGGGAGNFS